MAHRGGAQVKVFQIEEGGHLLRVGGAETLKSPLRLATEAKPRRPPEDSQGEVSCPSFTPPTSPAPGGAEAGYLAPPLPPPPPPRALPPARAEGRWRTAGGRR